MKEINDSLVFFFWVKGGDIYGFLSHRTYHNAVDNKTFKYHNAVDSDQKKNHNAVERKHLMQLTRKHLNIIMQLTRKHFRNRSWQLDNLTTKANHQKHMTREFDGNKSICFCIVFYCMRFDKLNSHGGAGSPISFAETVFFFWFLVSDNSLQEGSRIKNNNNPIEFSSNFLMQIFLKLGRNLSKSWSSWKESLETN